MDKKQELWLKDPQIGIHRERKKKPELWLPDVITIGFDKQYFAENDLIKKIKKMSDTVNERTIWKKVFKENEHVYLVSRVELIANPTNKMAFNTFLTENVYNPQYTNKFVAFVNGKFEGVDEDRSKLVKEMYDKFGNVETYVGKVTLSQEIKIIDSPERY